MKPAIPLAVGLPLLLLLGQNSPLTAQSPITSYSASYQSASGSVQLYTALSVSLGAFGGCYGTLFTYSFSNGTSNQYKLNSFNANGNTYFVAPASASVVKLRRVNNTQAAGQRNIVYMESTSSTATACPLTAALNFKPPYVDGMEDLLAAGMLNQGTDNVFTNASNGDGNNNNIERVDVIFSSGLNTAIPSQAGFAIFDRGNNFQHDPFKIAAITSLNAAGDPAGFGPVKTCIGGNGSSNGNWGHPSTANGNKQLACYVMRKDASDAYLRVSSNVNQEIGGVFYTFSDLGITAGQPLYGYALLGPDGIAAPTSSQLLNLNDASVYPTQTTEAMGGGLDLVAVNTVFATGGYVTLSLPANPAPPAPRPAPSSPVTGWQLFPTMPVQGQSLQLQGLQDGGYTLAFYSASGVCRKVPVRISGGKATVPPPVVPGIYWVQVSGNDRIIPGKTNILIQ